MKLNQHQCINGEDITLYLYSECLRRDIYTYTVCIYTYIYVYIYIYSICICMASGTPEQLACWYSGVVFPDALSEVGRTGRQWCDWKRPWNHQDPEAQDRGCRQNLAAVQPSKAPFQLILMDRCCERFRVPSHDNLRYYLTRKNGHIGITCAAWWSPIFPCVQDFKKDSPM